MQLRRISVILLACATLTSVASSQVVPNPSPMPQTEPAKPRRIRISAEVAQRFLVKKVEPLYPAMLDAQGTVVLRVLISKEGMVDGAEAISGLAVLQKLSIDAVQQWRYRPYILNGEAAAVETTVVLNFHR